SNVPSANLTTASLTLKSSNAASWPLRSRTCPTTKTGCPFRLVRRSLSVLWVAEAQEKFPLELVPAVGIFASPLGRRKRCRERLKLSACTMGLETTSRWDQLFKEWRDLCRRSRST